MTMHRKKAGGYTLFGSCENGNMTWTYAYTGGSDSMPSEKDARPSHRSKKKTPTTPAEKPPSFAKSCIGYWWKLPVLERFELSKVMKIHLLSPILFGRVFQDATWIKWAQDTGFLSEKDCKDKFNTFLTLEEHENTDLLETAISLLLEGIASHLRDGSAVTEESSLVLEDMDKCQKISSLTSGVEQVKKKKWFCKVRKDLNGESTKVHVAIYLAAWHMLQFMRLIVNGGKPSMQLNELANLIEAEKLQKADANTLYQSGLYEKAIQSYSDILRKRPFCHILYGNRAMCYLQLKSYKHALADGWRAVVLEPGWEKGQYRFIQALHLLNMNDTALRKLRDAKKSCKGTSKLLDLERIIEQRKNSKDTTVLAVKEQSFVEVPPPSVMEISGVPAELASASSGDTSENDDYEDDHNDQTEQMFNKETDGKLAVAGQSNIETPHVPATDTLCDGQLIDQIERSGQSDRCSTDEFHGRDDEADNEAENEVENEAESEDDPAKNEEYALRSNAEHNGAVSEGEASLVKRSKEDRIAEMALTSARPFDLNRYLKEGTESFLRSNYQSAIEFFTKALQQLNLKGPAFPFSRQETVILRYSRGVSYYNAGTYLDLTESISIFSKINADYDDMPFPPSYLALGQGYLKLNRFKDASVPLYFILDCDPSKCIGVCQYPGSSVIIPESNFERCQEAARYILSLCLHPPRPDAVCFYSNCKQVKTQIYFSDPDFKGFIRLLCTESCNLEFHVLCWKKLKATLGLHVDKDFFKDPCWTPDCVGLIYKIQRYGEDSGCELKSEIFDSELSDRLYNKTKRKPVIIKSNRIAASSERRYQKVLEKRRYRQEKRLLAKEPVSGVDIDGVSVVTSIERAISKQTYSAYDTHVPGVQQSESIATACVGNVSDSSLIVLKKEASDCFVKPKKAKKKKKSKAKIALDHGFTYARNERGTLMGADDVIAEVGNELVGASVRHTNALDAFDKPCSFCRDAIQDLTSPLPAIPNAHESARAVFKLLENLIFAEGSVDISNDPGLEKLQSFFTSDMKDLVDACGGLPQLMALSNKFIFCPLEKNIVRLVKYACSCSAALQHGSGFSPTDHEALFSSDRDFLRSRSGRFGSIVSTSSSVAMMDDFDVDARSLVPSSDSGLIDDDTEDDGETGESTPGYADAESECSSTSNIENNSHSEMGSMDMPGTRIPVNVEQPGIHYKLSSPISSVRNPPGFSAPVCESDFRNDVSETKPHPFYSMRSAPGLNAPVLRGPLPSSQYVPRGHWPVYHPMPPDPRLCYSYINGNLYSPVYPYHRRLAAAPVDGYPPSGHLGSHFNAYSPVMSGGADYASAGSIPMTYAGPSTVSPVGLNRKAMSAPHLTSRASMFAPRPYMPPPDKECVNPYAENTVPDPDDDDLEPICVVEVGIMVDLTAGERAEQTEKLERLIQEKNMLQRQCACAADELKSATSKHLAEEASLRRDLAAANAVNEDLRKQLSGLEKGMKALDTEKKLLADKLQLVNDRLTQAAEDKRRLENAKVDLEDIVCKLGSSLTEQSRRAHKVEVAWLELQRDVAVQKFAAANMETLRSLQAFDTMPIDQAPELSRMRLSWLEYQKKCGSLFQECKSEFDQRLAELKGGTPLENISPVKITGPLPLPSDPLPARLPTFPANRASSSIRQDITFPDGTQVIPPLVGKSSLENAARRASPTDTATPTDSPVRVAKSSLENAERRASPSVAATPTDGPVRAGVAGSVKSSEDGVSDDESPRGSSSGSKKNKMFEELLLRLGRQFFHCSREELTRYVKQFRASRPGGSLTGLKLEKIVEGVAALITNDRQPSAADANLKQSALLGDFPRLSSTPTSPRSPVDKVVRPSAARATERSVAPPRPGSGPGGPRASAASIQHAPWLEASSVAYRNRDGDDDCVICHEPIDARFRELLQCSHYFHKTCIRRWLKEQQTCPTCRKLALLQDDYPSLTK